MGRIYNRKQENEKRKILRHNMTKAEVLMWLQIKGKKINGFKFRRQYSVGSYVLDFYCPKLKLAIEIDGATHITDDEKEYDVQRQEEIESLGIKFLRFSNLEIYENLSNVLDRIKKKTQELNDV